MVAVLMTKRVLASLAVTFAMLAGPALGRTGEDKFYQAYYLEHAKCDAAGAAKLYAEVADARDVDAAVKAQAESVAE